MLLSFLACASNYLYFIKLGDVEVQTHSVTNLFWVGWGGLLGLYRSRFKSPTPHLSNMSFSVSFSLLNCEKIFDCIYSSYLLDGPTLSLLCRFLPYPYQYTLTFYYFINIAIPAFFWLKCFCYFFSPPLYYHFSLKYNSRYISKQQQ